MTRNDIREVAEVGDPSQKAKRAHDLLGEYQEGVTELLRLRREGIEGMWHQGRTQKEIAELLGVSTQAVNKAVKKGPPPARALLRSGSGPLIIAVGEKREAEKEHGPAGPAVAAEDLAAYDMLAALARTLQLEIRYETIAPPGLIDLNRDNLVVICGPRLSPLIAQVLASDPWLSFDHDDQGWYLHDAQTGQTYRSPLDDGVNADYAYLGRLPRPDGRGAFVYIAGIHAIGATGVTHWLGNHLADLYAEVGRKNRLFSTVIRCEADSTRTITSSERVTPVYLRGGSVA